MSDPVNAQWAMLVVLIGIGGLVGIVAGVSTIYGNLRRKPPIEQEVYRDFVRREELAQVEARTNCKIEAIATAQEANLRDLASALRQLQAASEAGMRDLTLAIGRLMGQIEAHLKEDARPR